MYFFNEKIMALPMDMIMDEFNKVPKCMIEWKIQKFKITQKSECLDTVKVIVKNKNWWFSYFNWTLLSWECTIDWVTEIFSKNDLKFWKNVKYILNKENYYPLQYDIYSVKSEKFPYCTWNEISYNNFYYYIIWWLFILILWIIIFSKKFKTVKKSA